MTSQSHKKHQTTRLSRQVWKASFSGLTVAVTALMASPTEAQQPAIHSVSAQNRAVRTIRLVSEEVVPESSPLEKLKQRSAQERFEELQSLPLTTPRTPPVREPAALPMPEEVPENENKLPLLPDLNSVEEFAPFAQPGESTQQPLPMDSAIQPKLVPAPVPVPLKLNTSVQVSELPIESSPPDTVRSLSSITPYHDYESLRQRELFQGSQVEGVNETRVPKDLVFPDEDLKPRLSPDSLFTWEATNLYHNPLYFEDPTLERYGHVHPCIQPLLSTGRVGVQLLGLPYQTVIDSPHTKRYALGWYQPGDAAPKLFYQIPLNIEAAVAEALAVSVGVLAIP